MKKVLFLCTGNSCRSQMAEGFAKKHLDKNIEFYSAGVEAHGLNPRAVKTMNEFGIDISQHESKTLEKLNDIDFDIVLTVCGDAHERCPAYLKKAKIIHHGFPDPAKAKGTEEEIMNQFKDVAAQIQTYLKKDFSREL